MFKSLFQKEFFHDRLALGLAVAGLLLGILNFLLIILRVQSRDYDIPIRYTQYGGSPIELGDWYQLYGFASFCLIALGLNLVLAMRLHPLRRYLAITILTLNLFIMVMLFLVGNSLIGIAPTG